MIIETLIKEILKEDDELSPAPLPKKKSKNVGLEKDSLDAQIDSYLVKAERRSAGADDNIAAFASELVRLSQNLDNLVDIRATVLARGLSYVSDHLGQESVKTLIDALREYHEIDLTKMGDVLTRNPLGVGALPGEGPVSVGGT